MEEQVSTDISIESNGHCCKDLLQAAVCMPLSAGDSLESTKLRDGKISSLVSLSMMASFLTAVMFISFGSTSIENAQTHIDIVQIAMTGLLCVSTLIYVIFLCFHRRLSENDGRLRSHLFVKIVFVSFFTPCNLAFLISYLLSIFQCSEDGTINLVIHKTFPLATIAFTSVQTVFILKFSSKRFHNHCFINFCASVLLVTNVASASYQIITEHFHMIIKNNGEICANSTKVYEIYYKLSPYLRPTLIENSLLALLILREIFTNVRRVSSVEYELSTNISNTQRTNITPNRRLKITMYVALGVIMAFPYFFFKLYKLENGGNLSVGMERAMTITYVLVKGINYLVLIACFYILKRRCSENQYQVVEHTSLNLSHYLILVSGFGSAIFFSLQLIASFPDENRIYIIKSLLQITTTYVQTVLILQMKDYRKIETPLPWCFLFLSFYNLGTWAYDTFVPFNYWDDNDYDVKFYGKDTFISLRHVLIPILIFYRFKCFLSFLELSEVNRKDMKDILLAPCKLLAFHTCNCRPCCSCYRRRNGYDSIT